jgi:hypothetical protein
MCLMTRGTATELWETAIGKYPEIVAKYEFSGELLQSMLGIPVDTHRSTPLMSSGGSSRSMTHTAMVPIIQ